jgi:hypothetical protein
VPRQDARSVGRRQQDHDAELQAGEHVEEGRGEFGQVARGHRPADDQHGVQPDGVDAQEEHQESEGVQTTDDDVAASAADAEQLVEENGAEQLHPAAPQQPGGGHEQQSPEDDALGRCQAAAEPDQSGDGR